MPRFYLPLPMETGQAVELPEAVARHIQVLRLQVNDNITLFNGKGLAFSASITAINKRSIDAKINHTENHDHPPALNITLVQALSSADRMDFSIQKAVELGVSHIQPILTERSARLAADRSEKRQQHWQQVIIAACEQCGRNTLPTLAPLMQLRQYVAEPLTDLRLVLAPTGAKRLAELPPPKQHVTLLIGAEGGLSNAELHQLQTQGWQNIILGPRILRTETAGLAALAAMQTLWGDF